MHRRAALVLTQEVESKWLISYSSLCTKKDHKLYQLLNTLVTWEEIALGLGNRFIWSQLDPTVKPYALESHKNEIKINNTKISLNLDTVK